ncbi:MAG: hypothetical protein ACI9GO_000165 [Bacteroidia bacterium]|jgi:hypothetical protein
MKLKTLFVAFVVAGLFSSCISSHTAVVTNNPVGSKTGVAKGLDSSFKTAKENGKISKVGIAETRVAIIGGIKTTVTGE